MCYFFTLAPRNVKEGEADSKHPGRLSLCYNILTLSLKKRMAAETVPRERSRHSAEERDRDAESAREEEERGTGRAVHRVHRHHTDHRAKHQQQQRGDSSWHSAHPTLRERQGIQINWRIKFWDVYFTSNLTFFNNLIRYYIFPLQYISLRQVIMNTN